MWYNGDEDRTIEFGNEGALTWETISQDLYEDARDIEGLEYYDYDNNISYEDKSIEVSQTIFNDDAKWEYIARKYGPTEFIINSLSIDFDDNGKLKVERYGWYVTPVTGYAIMNEDGAEVANIANPNPGDGSLYIDNVLVIGNKKYLAGWDDCNQYLFDLDNLDSVALIVERQSNMREVSQGDVVEIILPKNAANGEVGIVAMNGHTIGSQKVANGQSTAIFNSANLAKGVYNATFTHQDVKREAQKVHRKITMHPHKQE